jgi:hypothetical protein
MTQLSVEEIDLVTHTDGIRNQLGDTLEASYLRGKTVLRGAVVAQLGCSDVEAEQLVETLELQGFVAFPHLPDETHPAGRLVWRIGHR